MKAPKDYPNDPPPTCPWGTFYPAEWKLLPDGGRKIIGLKNKRGRK